MSERQSGIRVLDSDNSGQVNGSCQGGQHAGWRRFLREGCRKELGQWSPRQ